MAHLFCLGKETEETDREGEQKGGGKGKNQETLEGSAACGGKPD